LEILDFFLKILIIFRNWEFSISTPQLLMYFSTAKSAPTIISQHHHRTILSSWKLSNANLSNFFFQNFDLFSKFLIIFVTKFASINSSRSGRTRKFDTLMILKVQLRTVQWQFSTPMVGFISLIKNYLINCFRKFFSQNPTRLHSHCWFIQLRNCHRVPRVWFVLKRRRWT
jgi:hypothetical protein